MDIEIERKFLVNKGLWLLFDKPLGEYIIQGYLTTDIDKTIRVRTIGSVGYLTIKGRTTHISREEFELEVPIKMASEMILKFADHVIEKIRYTLIYNGKKWEVDEFLGENQGLILAEVELITEYEAVELPEWIEREVSDDDRYFNLSLSISPFKSWTN